MVVVVVVVAGCSCWGSSSSIVSLLSAVDILIALFRVLGNNKIVWLLRTKPRCLFVLLGRWWDIVGS